MQLEAGVATTPLKDQEEVKKDSRIYIPLAGLSPTNNLSHSFISVPKSTSNRAFFFIKPHANTPATISFVHDWLSSQGFELHPVVTLTGELLREKFDIFYKEHYRIGITLRCSEYSVSQTWNSAFRFKFGISWSEALKTSHLVNAADCLKLFELSAEELMKLWLAALSRGRVLILDEHFHCALLDSIPSKGTVICVNGYLPALIDEYSSPSASISCYNVEWPSDQVMTWSDFLDRIIGDANPSQALENSLRKVISNEWEELGLPFPPNLFNNCIHASAGAFEAFANRSLWLDSPWMEDPVGSKLFSLGLTPPVVTTWLSNPLMNGRRLFSFMEGLGTEETLCYVKDIALSHGPFLSSAVPVGKRFSSPERTPSANSAFVFLSPSLSKSPAAVAIVKDILMTRGFILTAEGILNSLSDRVVDRHFSLIAEGAMTLHPRQVKLRPASLIQFQKKFFTSWGKELNAGRILNAAAFAYSLRIDYSSLLDLWLEAKEGDRVLEVASGISCALLRTSPISLFCINGFYPSLRLQFTSPSATVHFFQVEWVSHLMNWEHFLTRVIGRGNAKLCQPGSISHLLHEEWRDLGLSERSDGIVDCLHASASAFEAMVELRNWLNQPISESFCGRKLLDSGIPLEVISAWCKNPLVCGERVFDRMKFRGTDSCLDIALRIYASQSPYVAQSDQLGTSSSQLLSRYPHLGPHSSRSPTGFRESSLASQMTPPDRLSHGLHLTPLKKHHSFMDCNDSMEGDGGNTRVLMI